MLFTTLSLQHRDHKILVLMTLLLVGSFHLALFAFVLWMLCKQSHYRDILWTSKTVKKLVFSYDLHLLFDFSPLEHVRSFFIIIKGYLPLSVHPVIRPGLTIVI